MINPDDRAVVSFSLNWIVGGDIGVFKSGCSLSSSYSLQRSGERATSQARHFKYHKEKNMASFVACAVAIGPTRTI